MPRKPRHILGGTVYHVMNRASGRAEIFRKDADYAAFEQVLTEAQTRLPMRLLTYTLMPNHFHLVLWPRMGQGSALSEFMRWLTVTHTQRWHAHHGTSGTGHLYQGRFKAFPVQGGRLGEPWAALRSVCRYVERNALRAQLIERAEDWRWSGLWRRLHATADEKRFLTEWPDGAYPGDRTWLTRVNLPQTAAEEAALAVSMKRGRPLGESEWIAEAAKRTDLQHTLRPKGRPRKSENDS